MLSIKSQNKLKSVSIGLDAINSLNDNDFDAHDKLLTKTMQEVRSLEPEKFWTDDEAKAREKKFEAELKRRKWERERMASSSMKGEINE